jgi:hypothetical protein
MAIPEPSSWPHLSWWRISWRRRRGSSPGSRPCEPGHHRPAVLDRKPQRIGDHRRGERGLLGRAVARSSTRDTSPAWSPPSFSISRTGSGSRRLDHPPSVSESGTVHRGGGHRRDSHGGARVSDPVFGGAVVLAARSLGLLKFRLCRNAAARLLRTPFWRRCTHRGRSGGAPPTSA